MAIYETFDYKDCLIDISDDNSASVAIDLGGRSLVAIIVPAAITGTALTFTASETFNASIANYKEVTDVGGTAVTVNMAVNDYVVVDPASFIGVNHIRIVSNDDEAADRTFVLVTRML